MENIFYIAQLLGALNAFAAVTIILSVFALICFAIWFFNGELYKPSNTYEEDCSRICRKWIRISTITTIVAILVATFVPSKQTYLLMVGGHALEEIANSEKVQERASHTIDLLDQYLENKVKDSSKE